MGMDDKMRPRIAMDQRFRTRSGGYAPSRAVRVRASRHTMSDAGLKYSSAVVTVVLWVSLSRGVVFIYPGSNFTAGNGSRQENTYNPGGCMGMSVGSEINDSADQGLSALFRQGVTESYKLVARPGNNLGNPTLIFSIPMAEFFRMSIIANDVSKGEVAQRKLDPAHAFRLGQFMLKGLLHASRLEANERQESTEDLDRILHRMNPQPYAAMQPVVVNIRTAGVGGRMLRGERMPATGPVMGYSVSLSQKDLMYVVDGQHRRMGIEMVLDFLEEVRRDNNYPKIKSSLYPYEGEREVSGEDRAVWERVYTVARSVCTIAAEAHLGLTLEQERQLFHDLNNLTKPVEKSLALQFDSANPVNQFIKTELIVAHRVNLASGDKVDWADSDTGAMSRKDLVAVNAHLFLNKSNINGAATADIDQKIPTAIQFWDAVIQCDGFGDSNARARTVLAQPVVQKAIAKLTYDFAFGRPKQRSAENLQRLLDSLTDLDFSHSNPIWRYYEFSPEEREQHSIAGLEAYLPPAGTGNRDVGAFDPNTQVMRFGAKHNDIFPIIGDMIRFQLKLPSRHQEPVEPT